MFAFILALSLETRWVRVACVFLGYYEDSMSYPSSGSIGLCVRTCMFVNRERTIFC